MVGTDDGSPREMTNTSSVLIKSSSECCRDRQFLRPDFCVGAEGRPVIASPGFFSKKKESRVHSSLVGTHRIHE